MRLPSWSSFGVAVLTLFLLVVGVPSGAEGQSVDDLRGRFLLPEVQLGQTIPGLSDRSTPGSNAGSPSAFGPNWGDAFIGTGFTVNRFSSDQDFRDRIDGSVVAGFGLGDSAETVGLELSAVFLSTIDSGFGSRMSYGFKLHRLLPGSMGVAVGVENAITTGEGLDGTDPTFYGVGSKIFALKEDPREPLSTVTVSLGLGNGRFRFEDDVFEDNNKVNLFGAVGVRVLEPVSVIADWSGQDLILGASLVPFRSVPLVITPGVADLLGTAGDGARLMVGAGMGANVGSLFSR